MRTKKSPDVVGAFFVVIDSINYFFFLAVFFLAVFFLAAFFAFFAFFAIAF